MDPASHTGCGHSCFVARVLEIQESPRALQDSQERTDGLVFSPATTPTIPVFSRHGHDSKTLVGYSGNMLPTVFVFSRLPA